MNILVQQSTAALGHKEVQTAVRPKMSITPFGVTEQGFAGCLMQGQKARLAELALSYRQYAIVEVDVAALQPDRFGQTHACHRDQPEQIMIGPTPQSVCRWQGQRRRRQETLNQMNPVRNYLLLVTYDCNLRCTYCFEKHLRKPAMLSEAQLEQVLGVIQDVDSAAEVRSGRDSTHPPTVTLSGGEPLSSDHATAALLSRVVQFCATRGFKYRVVTNGVNLAAYVPALSRGQLLPDQIQVTLDGPAEIHDSRRAMIDGSGSFHAIVKGINAALAAGISVLLRTNVDALNVDSVSRLAAFIKEQGWHRGPFRSYLAPVTDHTLVNDRYTGLTNSADLLGQVLAQMRSNPELGRFLPARGFRGFASVERTLTHKGAAVPSFWRCEAIMGQLVFDPLGRIYSCVESVGVTEAEIGRYLPDFELDRKRQSVWRQLNCFTNDTCKDCRVRFVCGGGCAAHMMRCGTGACLPIEAEVGLAWNFYHHRATTGGLPSFGRLD